MGNLPGSVAVVRVSGASSEVLGRSPEPDRDRHHRLQRRRIQTIRRSARRYPLCLPGVLLLVLGRRGQLGGWGHGDRIRNPATMPTEELRDCCPGLRSDGILCAYLAYYYWCWGEEGSWVVGDMATGYVTLPRCRLKNCAIAAPASDRTVSSVPTWRTTTGAGEKRAAGWLGTWRPDT